MTLDLNAIKARVEAATPGPWAYDGSGVWHVNSGGPITQPLDSRDPPDGIARVGDSYPRGDNHPTENMAFIAHARQDIPALLQEIERLTAERDGAHRAMKAVCHDEPEDEGIAYVCCDENGDPQIEAATLGEAITQLNEWFGAFQRSTEKKVWALEATTKKDEETMGAYRRVNIEQTERADVAESRLARLTADHAALRTAAEKVRKSGKCRCKDREPCPRCDAEMALDDVLAALGGGNER